MDTSEIIFSTGFDFHGGIHPEEHKTLSNQSPIQSAPIPPQLIIPLNQHIGEPAEVLVNVGDKVKTGQCIAKPKDGLSAAVHASYSGTVLAIEKRDIPHPSGMQDWCVVIETDSDSETKNDNDDSIQFLPPIESPLTVNKQLLLDRIHECGVVGMGGAGFPTHVKLLPSVETLIINAAECEPYITCDDRLLQDETEQLIKAFELLAVMLEAKECIIGIEDNKPDAIAALEQQLSKSFKDNLQIPIRICVVPTKYPSGGEKQLIELITGQQVPRNEIPLSLGIVLHNVATALAVYESITQGKPLIERVVTLTGQACQQPGNVRVRIGTPMHWLLQQYNAEDYETLIMGGPMMGFEIHQADAPVVKTTNCLIAATHGELKTHQQALPCIRCGECATACPASLLPQQLYWFARSDDFEKAEDYHLFDCIECGACSYVCPSEIPLVHYYRYAKTTIRNRNEEKRKADMARERFEFREMRLAREKAERAEKHRKAAEARKKAAQAKGEQDEKKATVAEAIARAKAKKKNSDSTS